MDEKMVNDLISLVANAIKTNTREEAIEYLVDSPLYSKVPKIVFVHTIQILTV